MKRLLGSFFLIAMLGGCGKTDQVVLETANDYIELRIATSKQKTLAIEGYDVVAIFRRQGESDYTRAVVDGVDVASDFASLYPRHSWIARDVIRFDRAPAPEGALMGRVTIRNETNNMINAIAVKASGSEFVALYTGPNREVELAFPVAATEANWISCLATTVNGQIEAGRSYYLDGGANFPEPFLIRVTDGEIQLDLKSARSEKQ